MSFQQKYLKYKSKYLDLKNQFGGGYPKIGDTIFGGENFSENWGVINYEEDNVFKLNDNRIIKKKNMNIKWIFKSKEQLEQEQLEQQEQRQKQLEQRQQQEQLQKQLQKQQQEYINKQ
jgi:hypothetical protein